MYQSGGEALRAKVHFRREISPTVAISTWLRNAAAFIGAETHPDFDADAERYLIESRDKKNAARIIKSPTREEWITQVIQRVGNNPRVQETRFADSVNGVWMEYSAPLGSLEQYKDILKPVRSILETIESFDGEVEVLSIPEYVADDLDMERLVDEIEDDKRTMPLVILTEHTKGESPDLDAAYAAEVTAGFAHIRIVSEQATYRLSDIIGKSNSAFLGYGRSYEPGFGRSRDRNMSVGIHAAKLVGASGVDILIRIASRATDKWSIPTGNATTPTESSQVPQTLELPKQPKLLIKPAISMLVTKSNQAEEKSAREIQHAAIVAEHKATVNSENLLDSKGEVSARTNDADEELNVTAESGKPQASAEKISASEPSPLTHTFNERISRLSEKFTGRVDALTEIVQRLQSALDDAELRIEDLELSRASRNPISLPDGMVAIERKRLDDFVYLADMVVDTGRQVREDQAKINKPTPAPIEPVLTDDLESPHSEAPNEVEYPSELDEHTIKEFVEKHLKNVTLHARALRAVKKTQYKNPSRVFRALEILDNRYAAMRRGEGGVNMDDFVEALAEIQTNVKVRKISSHMSDEYSVTYKGRREKITHEICSNSSPFDKSRILRVYFFWDSEDRKVVVCHLPDHLPIMNERS